MSRILGATPRDISLLPETVIRPLSGAGLFSSLRTLWNYRELLWTLTVREVQVRYKQAALGAAWAIIQPLCMMFVFTIFFGRLAGMPSDGIPYPIFVYSALLPWTFFAGSLQFAMVSLASNANLLTKVYFPREVLPLSCIFASSVDFGIAGLVFVVLLLFHGISVSLTALYVIPLLLMQVIFTVAIGLVLSAVNVYFRDVRYALPLAIQLWMFATPIVYPLSIVPEQWRTLYVVVNPMASLVDGYRRAIVQGVPPDFPVLALAAGVAIFLLMLCYRIFKQIEGSIADVV